MEGRHEHCHKETYIHRKEEVNVTQASLFFEKEFCNLTATATATAVIIVAKEWRSSKEAAAVRYMNR